MPELTGNFQPGFLRMPRLPVAGFWIRLVALTLDVFVVLGAMHLLSRSLPDFYWALGRWSPYLNSLVTFLYFALFNSEFGKGRTVGKLILRLQVTDFDGKPVTIRQSVIRTVVLFPVFVLAPIGQTILGRPSSVIESYAWFLFNSAPMIAMPLATAITVAFNPFKQGMHDYLAQSLVRPVRDPSEPLLSFEQMAAGVGAEWPKFQRQPQYSGAVTFAMVFVALAVLAYPGQQRPEIREIQASVYELNNLPEFSNSNVIWNRPTLIEFYNNLHEQYQLPALEDDDSLSTDSLVFIVEARTDRDWRKMLTEEQSSQFTEKLSHEFADRIIPKMANIAWAADTEESKELLRKMARPIAVLTVLSSEVSLTPYPWPLTRTDFHRQENIGPFKLTGPANVRIPN